MSNKNELKMQAEGMAAAKAVISGKCDICKYYEECSNNYNFRFPRDSWCTKEKERILRVLKLND